MITYKPIESSNHLPDEAADSGNSAFESTPRVANEALDSPPGSVQKLGGAAAPLINRSSDQIGVLARRALDAMSDSSQQLRDKVRRTSESAVGHVKNEPVKAILIAAVAGAALMALLGLMTRSRRP